MPQTTSHQHHRDGQARQAAALRALQQQAHRLIGGLDWISEDVAGLLDTLDQLAGGGASGQP